MQDGQGFPYLSEACYWYLPGNVEKAISMLTLDDVGTGIQSVVGKVNTEVMYISEFIYFYLYN